MKIANRLARLGTETAFAVSEDARLWAAQGHPVYPFHLGDMNLPTPENIVQAALKALRDGRTGYCPAAGIPELRAAYAEDVGRDRGLAYAPEQVSIQPGGKPVIGKFLQAVMNEGDAVLYPNPGYPIYESQIQYFGGSAIPYGYDPSPTGFRIRREQLAASVTPRTVAMIYNNGQNPLGAESDEEEMRWVAEFVQRHNLLLLSDEAYFHVRYSGRSRSIASLPGMQERTVILVAHSKRYAMTGWRLGAAVGPKAIIDIINKLNVNMESCTAHFIQWAGVEALRGDQSGSAALVRTLKERRDALAAELQKIPGVTIRVPEVTFYLFPDVTEVHRRKGYADQQALRLDALHRAGVSFCSRSHFGKPAPDETRVFVRFAYSGISTERIGEGLKGLAALWGA